MPRNAPSDLNDDAPDVTTIRLTRRLRRRLDEPVARCADLAPGHLSLSVVVRDILERGLDEFEPWACEAGAEPSVQIGEVRPQVRREAPKEHTEALRERTKVLDRLARSVERALEHLPDLDRGVLQKPPACSCFSQPASRAQDESDGKE